MANLDVIQQNLAELLTNTVDMAAVFYDIFLNPQPMDINIQMFDDNNQLITVTIPNRAKDRITPYVGEGSPEGVVGAPIGSTYVDTANSTVYYKVSGEATDTYGWNAVISQSLMETFIRTYLEARGYITTSSLNTYLITHEYVTLPALSTYLNVNGYIRGRDLEDISVISLNNKLMIVTEDETDFLKNISFGGLLANSISSDANNGLTRGSDSKLSIPVGDGLKVNNGNVCVKNGDGIGISNNGDVCVKNGDGIDINSSSEVCLSPATPNQIGGVKIGSGIDVQSDGTISTQVRNIGEIVTSTIPVVDADLHLLDGSLLSYGTYKDFIDYIASLYNSGNYTAIFDTEANWQSSVTTYGVCGKFVYNSLNNTVRLPKIIGFVEGAGGTATLGDVVEAGLPNITGNLGRTFTNAGTVDGAFSKTVAGAAGGGSEAQLSYIDMDASRSSSIYGNSNTVQPQSIKVLYYIVIANTTKTQIEADIDEIATDLNGKADVDLVNASDSGRILMSGMGMPSETYEDLVLGATGTTYTAPANGWVQITQAFSTACQMELSVVYNNKDGICMGSISSSSYILNLYIPVLKNEMFKVTYDGTLDASEWNRFQFIYAKGSESEAL